MSSFFGVSYDGILEGIMDASVGAFAASTYLKSASPGTSRQIKQSSSRNSLMKLGNAVRIPRLVSSRMGGHVSVSNTGKHAHFP